MKKELTRGQEEIVKISEELKKHPGKTKDDKINLANAKSDLARKKDALKLLLEKTVQMVEDCEADDRKAIDRAITALMKANTRRQAAKRLGQSLKQLAKL